MPVFDRRPDTVSDIELVEMSGADYRLSRLATTLIVIATTTVPNM